MAERENFFLPYVEYPRKRALTEREVLDFIIQDDEWDDAPRTISECKSLFPDEPIFKISISVERVK